MALKISKVFDAKCPSELRSETMFHIAVGSGGCARYCAHQVIARVEPQAKLCLYLRGEVFLLDAAVACDA